MGIESGDGDRQKNVELLLSQGYAALGQDLELTTQNDQEHKKQEYDLNGSLEKKNTATVSLLQKGSVVIHELIRQHRTLDQAQICASCDTNAHICDVKDTSLTISDFSHNLSFTKIEIATSPYALGKREASRCMHQSPLSGDEYLADTSCASTDSRGSDIEPRASLEWHRLEECGGENGKAMELHAETEHDDVSEMVGAQQSEHTELLVLLRALLNQKNVEISTLSSSLNNAHTVGNRLQQDLATSSQTVAHVSSALRLEEGEVQHLRLAMHVRDTALRRQSVENSARCAQLLQRVATLEAHNQSLWQLHRDHTVKSRVEQNLLQGRIEESLSREAALEGQRVTALREKELLLANASARMQSQEQCVSDCHQQLELALSDNMRIQHRMADYIDVHDAACIIGGGGLVENRTRMAHAVEQAMPYSLTHYFPSAFTPRSAAGGSGSARISAAPSPKDLMASTGCGDTLTSDSLFVHNQILCNEVWRLRQERASELPHLYASACASSSSPHATAAAVAASVAAAKSELPRTAFPTESRACSPHEAADMAATSKAAHEAARHFELAVQHTRALTNHGLYSTSAGTLDSTAASHVHTLCPPLAAHATSSHRSPLMRSESGGNWPMDSSSPPAVSLSPSSQEVVSCQWIGAMDGAGWVERAAQATVLFASPPPQLSRDYEPLSDWV